MTSAGAVGSPACSPSPRNSGHASPRISSQPDALLSAALWPPRPQPAPVPLETGERSSVRHRSRSPCSGLIQSGSSTPATPTPAMPLAEGTLLPFLSSFGCPTKQTQDEDLGEGDVFAR